VDKVVGLKLSADYLTSRSRPSRLMARLSVAAARPFQPTRRRHPSSATSRSISGRWSRPRRRLLDLSAREFKLLRHFIAHRGATLSRDQLLADVWGYDEMPLTRTVDVHVAGLRQQIEANPKVPEYILTVHGLGYKFAG
jgi:two-component system alkaline phosphatase synthesis response regulator PhoP